MFRGNNMVTTDQVKKQLKQAGCSYAFWGSTEVAELPSLLMDGEEISSAVNGYYEGGFGLLLATNFRVLVVDKKPFTLNVEDLRYDMISEVTYGARFMTATMHIAIPTRTVYFTTWSVEKLHKAVHQIQQHVMDARNGGSPLPDDWFARQLNAGRAAQSVSPIIKLARSALRGHSEAAIVTQQVGHSSAQHAINPYAKRSTLQHRRLPSIFSSPW